MLTLLHGTDAYRLAEASREVRRKADGVFRGADDLTALEDALKYPSLLGGARTLLVTDAAADGVADVLSVQEVRTRNDIALTAVQAVTAKPSAALKAALKQLTAMASEVRSFEPLAGAQLQAWMRSFCGARGTTITDQAANLLAERTDDSWTLASELDKLCAYCGADPVGAEAVGALTAPREEHRQWALSDAVQAGDKRGALAHLWTSLARGIPEPLLAGAVASSVRTLLAVRDLAGQGLAAGAIASRSGMHPFVVGKSLRYARTADRTRLAAAHAALAALDRDVKRGRAEYADGLFSILLAL